MNRNRKLSVLALVSLAAACGGSAHSNAAASRSFNYGPSQAPTTAEQSAVNGAQTQLSATSSFSASPDATRGASIVALAESLGAALGASAVPVRGPQPAQLSRAVTGSTAATSTCTTSTASSLTFNNCTTAEPNGTVTINGSINFTASTVSWDVTGTVTGSDTTGSFSVAVHEAGHFAVTSTRLTGSATAEVTASVTQQGQTINLGLDLATSMDLTYVTSPGYCVTAGTLEVKRVWTQKPNGASGASFTDAAAKITWTGCNTVTVAHSQ